MIQLEMSLIKWLYTTSGFYDNTVKSYSYMNVEYNVINSIVYETYMNNLLNIVKNSDALRLCFHKNFTDSINLIEQFVKTLNYKKLFTANKEEVFDFIKYKRLLIISPFAVLIKNQIENGNCKKIYPDFPEIESILTYTYSLNSLSSKSIISILLIG
jgi:hypothetical protein